MNWKRFFLNLAGVAAGGFATGVSLVPQDAPHSGKIIIGATVAPVIANLVGLFQKQPHLDGE